MSEPKITITKGAYIVEGNVPLYLDIIVPSSDGTHLEYHRLQTLETPADKYLLCRCGRSHNKPFCDFAHFKEKPEFDAPETASREPYEKRAQLFPGNGVKLYDDGRCAFARLCHYNNTSVWQMSKDERNTTKSEEIEAAWHCPTGRLTVADDKTGEVYEQAFEPSIVVLEDGGLSCSGPLFVRGGIPLVGEDGYVYEKQNRYALCRCGKTKTPPFCDATHHHIGFNDHLCADIDAQSATADTGTYDTSFLEKPDNLVE